MIIPVHRMSTLQDRHAGPSARRYGRKGPIASETISMAQKQRGRDDHGQRGLLAQASDERDQKRAESEPCERKSAGLRQDDAIDVARRRAEHAQDGKLFDVIEGGGIERLRLNHRADHDAENGAEDQGEADAGAKEPVPRCCVGEIRRSVSTSKSGRRAAISFWIPAPNRRAGPSLRAGTCSCR